MKQIHPQPLGVCISAVADWVAISPRLGALQQTSSSASTQRQEAAAVGLQPSAKEPSRAEFSTFLQSHQDKILRVATRLLRHRDDALDVLQEVALKSFKHWHELNDGQNIQGWLYRVTVNECYRWLRNRAKHPSQQEAPEAIPSQHGQQEKHLRTRQFQHFLSGALTVLSPQERTAFVLRDLEQCSGKEIAAIMDCEATTARGYYFSARKKLAAHIEEHAPEWLSLLG